MSTSGQFNSKSPTVKRILKEAAELQSNPDPSYTASPHDDNLFEWHFTLAGPPSSPYAAGLYHGRIVLPPQYPLRPPSFRFLTPTGRFEINREICLSISGHHEETWQPAWGLRTALVALRSFMATDAKGQVGGVEMGREGREKFARSSGEWRCGGCGRSNHEIMQEVRERCDEDAGKAEEQVPEELKLVDRQELGHNQGNAPPSAPKGKSAAAVPPSSTQPAAGTSSTPRQPARAPARPSPSRPVASMTSQAPARRATTAARTTSDDGVPAWVDKAIYGVIAALLFVVLKRMVV